MRKRVGAAVYRFNEGQIKYLLVTQNPKVDLWILPGGHPEMDETLQQTAYRETLEETGCEVKIQDQLGSFPFISHGKDYTNLIFLARLVSVKAGNTFQEITWITADQLDRFPIPAEARFLLSKAQKLLVRRIEEADRAANSFLGERVSVTVNRPIGTQYSGIVYSKNYGYIDGVLGKDGDYLDAYLLGVNKPLASFEGKCVAIIKRTNDLDDKLIVVPPETLMDADTINNETHFVEQFFESELILLESQFPARPPS